MRDSTSTGRTTVYCTQCGEETSSTGPGDDICLRCVTEMVRDLLEDDEPDGEGDTRLDEERGEALARAKLAEISSRTFDSFEEYLNTLTEVFSAHPNYLGGWQEFVWKDRNFSIRMDASEIQFRMQQSDETYLRHSPFALIDILSQL
jgi:hypothetical protein